MSNVCTFTVWGISSVPLFVPQRGEFVLQLFNSSPTECKQRSEVCEMFCGRKAFQTDPLKPIWLQYVWVKLSKSLLKACGAFCLWCPAVILSTGCQLGHAHHVHSVFNAEWKTVIQFNFKFFSFFFFRKKKKRLCCKQLERERSYYSTRLQPWKKHADHVVSETQGRSTRNIVVRIVKINLATEAKSHLLDFLILTSQLLTMCWDKAQRRDGWWRSVTGHTGRFMLTDDCNVSMTALN